MVENNNVQDEIVIRHALKKNAETVFKMIRSLTKYHGESAEFGAIIEDVETDGFGEFPLHEFWLAEVDKAPLGLATFFLCYSTFISSKAKNLVYAKTL